MNLNRRDGIPLVVLAVVEVAAFETLIRVGFVGIETASATLFILLLLNYAFIFSLRSLRR